MENNVVQNNKKGVSIIVCVLLVIVSFAVGIFAAEFVFNKENDNKAETVKESNSNSASNSNENEVPVQTKDKKELIAEIKDTIKTIENIRVSGTIKSEVYMKDVYNVSDVTTFKAYYSLISSSDPEFCSPVKTKKEEESYDDECDIQKTSAKVTEIYGNKPLTAYVQEDNFPSVNYVKATNKLYVTVRGGYGPVERTVSYIYDAKESGNNLEAYVAVGLIVDTDGGPTSVYSDYSKTKKLYNKEVEVDESNYQNFSKYKYTFVKNTNGTYRFEKLEKLK